MCPIFTREGDEGYSGLLGKGRFTKSGLRFEVLGDIDEATSAFGLARSITQSRDVASIILKVQRDLYSIMTEIASGPDPIERFPRINADHVTWLEMQIGSLEKVVKIPEEFILPGDCQAGAALDLARTIVRRAERHTVELIHQHQVSNNELLHYLNRLSSLCFILELFENQATRQSGTTLAKEYPPK
jgi:cob(I)alamin adenosyltransferase